MSKTVWWIIGGLVGLGLIVVVAVSIAGEEAADPNIGYGVVSVEGEALPVLADPASDVAMGLTAPTATGADADGVESTIGPDGRAKIIVFLAHWCPHCQAEVPVIQNWVDSGALPDDVDLYSVATLTDPLRQPFPPQAWLADAGWSSPVILDDEQDTVARAYGLGGTPMYVVVDGDNTVVQRVSGEIGVAGLDALADLASAS